MTLPRLPGSDPRTLARDIPGLLEPLFPNVLPGVVAQLNKQAYAMRECVPVALSDVQATTIARAMLFELAVTVAEQLASRRPIDWDEALSTAVFRQKRHFDARVPSKLEEVDKIVALRVARNLVTMLRTVVADIPGETLVTSPRIPGYQWVASGVGDFAVGHRLVEVKCTNRHFSSADYRQILIYWLLSYLAALERDSEEWTHAVLLNPRSGTILSLRFDDVLRLFSIGKSKIALAELFIDLVDRRRTHDQ